MNKETFQDDLFVGQTVFITGGTSGIGAATARHFHAKGATVIAAGLNAGVAPLQADERMRLLELDVTDEAAQKRAFAELDRLDHLVLCAGTSLDEQEWDIEAYRKIIDLNLTSAMTGALAASPLLTRNGGSIVTIASMFSFFGSAARPAYASSKGAIVQLTKSFALMYADKGVRANAVAPGWIDTPLASALDTETRDAITQRIPLQRWGTADEVAQIILFLCSPAASYVTGSVLVTDGGYLTS